MSDSTQPLRRRDRRRTRPPVLGVIAIVAGGTLLLGGGTTLAFWSVTSPLTTATVQTGNLDLAVGAASWTLNGAPVTFDANLRLVPGDTLVLTQTLTPTLVGANLRATLTANTASLPTTPFVPVVKVGTTTMPGQGIALTPAASGVPLTATVTLTIPSTVANRDNVNTAINLSGVTFTLTQNTNPVP